jgi:heme-binding NEAT domain protein
MKKALLFVFVLLLGFIFVPSNSHAQLADGTYSIKYQVNSAGEENASIANDYFLKPAKLFVSKGSMKIQLTMKNSAWITEFSGPHGGNRVVSENTAKDQRTVEFNIKSIDSPTVIKMKVDIDSMSYHHSYSTDFVWNASTLTLIEAAKTPDNSGSGSGNTSGNNSGNTNNQSPGTNSNSGSSSGSTTSNNSSGQVTSGKNNGSSNTSSSASASSSKSQGQSSSTTTVASSKNQGNADEQTKDQNVNEDSKSEDAEDASTTEESGKTEDAEANQKDDEDETTEVVSQEENAITDVAKNVDTANESNHVLVYVLIIAVLIIAAITGVVIKKRRTVN